MSAGGFWAPGDHGFPVDRLDEFLLWAGDRGASDVSFQTGAAALIEVDGRLRPATRGLLDAPAMELMISEVSHAAGESVVRQGDALDGAYAVRVGRGERRRFRVNVAPVQVRDALAFNVTLRVLPGAPPRIEDLRIEPGIVDAIDLCAGLSLVTGVPGSGKSTLLAAAVRRLLERGAGRIQSYEAPVEFAFDGIGAPDGASLMSSAGVGPQEQFETFAQGLRSSLRRRPAAVVVGEARDRETVEATVRAADYGIAVFSTTHTVGVAATVRRLLAELPAAERAERGAALVDVLNLVVTQALLPAPGGGRTAIREWLRFDGGLKADLLELPQDRWPGRISDAVAAAGTDLASAAEAAASDGRLEERDLLRIRAARGGGT